MSNTRQQIALPPFSLQSDQLPTYYTQLYREGGFRLEQQDIKDKHIFHNYGQGDAELSLSFGCAHIITKVITVKQDVTKIKQVAVIGSGINALMTCLQLLKRGYKVTLYTKSLPVKKENNKKIVEAESGLKIWYPGNYDNCDPLKHELIAKLSIQFFIECLYSNRYQSLREVNCYISTDKGDQIKQYVTQYINSDVKQVQLHFENMRIENYIRYRTILIDTKLFVEQIYTQLKLRSLAVVEKQFKTLQDVLSMKEKHIFNCLGFQCSTVFGDQSVKLREGYYYSIVPSSLKQHPHYYSLWISNENEPDFMVSVFGSKFQISNPHTSQQKGEKKKEQGQKILSRAYQFIKGHTIKPYKL